MKHNTLALSPFCQGQVNIIQAFSYVHIFDNKVSKVKTDMHCHCCVRQHCTYVA